MNTTPKSPAERTLQFIAITPDDISLPYDMQMRYESAYSSVVTSMNDGKPNVAVSKMEFAEKRNTDIITYGSPLGYLATLRLQRKQEESQFYSTLQSVDRFGLDLAEVGRKKQELRDNTIDLTSDNIDKNRLEELFPSGGYFLHSTDSNRIISILSQGELLSTAGFRSTEERQEKSNGGSLGVSGNYNKVSNILGDPKHLAGFIFDPKTVIAEQGGYFGIPAKSCWDELQYFGGNATEIIKVRAIESHFNAAVNLFSEVSIAHAAVGESDMPNELREKFFKEYEEGISAISENPMLAMRAYKVLSDGQFRFTDMLGVDGEPVMPLHVFVTALRDGLYGEEFANYIESLRPNELSVPLLEALNSALEIVGVQLDALMDNQGVEIGQKSKINPELGLLYCPAKDYEYWLDALAHLPNQPKGIVVYDDKEVRTPTAFSLLLPDNGMSSFAEQLKKLQHTQSPEWTSLFPEEPVVSPNAHYLVRSRDTGLAGAIILDDNNLRVKTLDEIFE